MVSGIDSVGAQAVVTDTPPVPRVVPVAPDSDVVDLDPATVDPRLIVGEEAAATEAQKNTLVIKDRTGVPRTYALPQFGPMLYVVMNDFQRRITKANEDRTFFKEKGLTDEQITSRVDTAVNLEFLEFIYTIGKDVGIQMMDLISMQWDDIVELSQQFRPFDGSAAQD